MSSEAAPAATVVVVRGASEAMEVLMVHRSTRHAFAGMWAFPGGRVDPTDGAATDDELERARRAAVREAEEETGIDLDPNALVPFAHWTPPPEAPRRFATWFFIAEAHEGIVDVSVDGNEIVDHEWIAPREALARHAQSEIQLATPTWVTLDALTQQASAPAAVDAARGRAPEFFATRIIDVDGTKLALWAGDAGYESGDVMASGARHRLSMPVTGGWTYERS